MSLRLSFFIKTPVTAMERLTQPCELDISVSYHGWQTAIYHTHPVQATQMTPPPSPFPIPRNGSNSQLSSLFRRSKSVRSTSTELLQDRFRTRSSVTEMKAPFPLLLPESASVSAFAQSSGMTPLSRSELRRMSVSYNDLRCLAQRQATSHPTTPLLPSPVIKEFPQETESYFKFRNPREPVPSRSTSDRESSDSLSILSYYCDGSEETSWSADKDSLKSQPSCQEPLVDDGVSTSSEAAPVTPVEQELPPAFCDESDWLANTTSHDERMRRFKSRYWQVVQQPWTQEQAEHGESQVVSASHCYPRLPD
jgi:hypothetical protein